INTYFVSWAARQAGLKVALSGLGGDELFAGYTNFADTNQMRRLVRAAWFVPAPLRRALAPMITAIAGGGASPDRGQKAAGAWRSPDALPHPYFFTRTLFPTGKIERIIDPQFRASTIHSDGMTLNPTWLGWLERAASEAQKLTPTAGTAWLEMRTYM